jgi:hypothetical protein
MTMTANEAKKHHYVPQFYMRRRLDQTLAARKPVLVYQKAPQAAAAEVCQSQRRTSAL